VGAYKVMDEYLDAPMRFHKEPDKWKAKGGNNKLYEEEWG